jgi:two-component system, NtrC family, response regulator AtoC
MSPSQTVLVVDDAAAIRLLCRVNLELDGHRVLEASSVRQARDLLAEGDVSLVLLDVHVGPDDGLEFLDELRRDHPGLRVALLTGSTELERVRKHNPDAVLGKPFELDQLRDVIAALADRKAGV